MYKNGTLVLIRNSARESKKGDKMKAHWLGPYAIEESLGKGVYRVSNITTGLILKKGVNQSRLTLYHGPNPLSNQRKSNVGNYNNFTVMVVSVCMCSL